MTWLFLRYPVPSPGHALNTGIGECQKSGLAENRIKEQQLGIFADRPVAWANQFRLLLTSR